MPWRRRHARGALPGLAFRLGAGAGRRSTGEPDGGSDELRKDPELVVGAGLKERFELLATSERESHWWRQ